ncbi:helix-turn-helix transcriptional regulator [candidate division TA06 bacterium]|uniref:Helix-turn-helix transcriptional regulator n=1 Tax=candidate division TA06 bacterium TaxID=2250710 RepID=A0A933ID33_UNCT6|nr:helix-turn-helix transcriptional regulator [candidate division TA06 bacterium]
MATLYQQIGQRIQTLRKQAGMTQEELSERADLSNTYIAMIEAGKRSPSIKALDKIAMALQVGITDLFGFSSNSPKIKTARTNNLSLTKTEALAIRTAVRILHKKTWSLN